MPEQEVGCLSQALAAVTHANDVQKGGRVVFGTHRERTDWQGWVDLDSWKLTLKGLIWPLGPYAGFCR